MSDSSQETRHPLKAARVRPHDNAWTRYGVAFVCVLAASLLTVALQRLMGARETRIPFAFFFPAVVVATLYGGRRAGLLTTVLSALVAAYFFIPPDDSLLVGVEGLLQLGVFVVVALLISYLAQRSMRAEASARRNEEWLATTLKSIGDAVIAADAEGRVNFMNDVAQSLTGWTAAEAKGRPLEDVFRIINEETRERVESPVTKVIREGKVVGLANHTLLLSKDGRETPIDDSGAPIRDDAGNISGVVLVFHDISERRRAEQIASESEEARLRLAAIVESSEDAIIGKTLEGIITSWNAGAERIYGYSPAEAVGRPISILVPADRPDEVPSILDSIKRGQGVEHLETVRVRKDGTTANISVAISPIRNSAGKIIGASTIARDITERKRSEQEREQLLRRAEEARREAELAADRTAHLQSVTAALSEALTPSEVADAVFEQGFKSLNSQGGAIVLLNQPGTDLDLVGSAGFPEEVTREWRSFPLATPVPLADATRTGEAVWLESFDEWMRLYPRGGILKQLPGVRSLAAVPLIVEGRTLGALGLSFQAERILTETDRAFILALARQCAQAIERARLYDAERLLRSRAEASEEQYRYLADSMPQIVWTARPDGYLDYYNRRWFEYTGMTLEETQGWGWQPVVHPQDLERCLRRWAKSVETGQNYEIEYRFRCAEDGTYRWHLGRAEPMRDAAGNIVKWFGTATDIDDQKRAVETSRFLAEASETLASTLNYQATLATLARLVVPRFADWCVIDIVEEDGTIRRTLTHSDPSKEELAHALSRRYPPDPGTPQGPARVLRTGQPDLYPEVPDELLRAVARDDEHLRSLQALGFKSYMCVPLLVRGRTLGTITFVSAESNRRYYLSDLRFAEDLAHRAALAVDNARLFQRTEWANRAKDEFLATLSHELRTPLTPIVGWVHMLRDGRLPESEMPHGLAIIDKNSQALARLINDLLDMSAIMSGKMRIERAPVELDVALEEAVEAVRTEAGKRGVALDIEFEPCDVGGTPRVVSGDRARLIQVFSNLLNNAVKFSPQGSHVTIACRSDAGAARVVVRDDGIGIPEEFLPHVFERFRQADSSTTRAYGGLGIGLALVKSFVEAHGGEVQAASEGNGRGSRFVVTLPLAASLQSTERDGGGAPAGSSPSEAPRAEVGVRRVLIVEDARDTLEMLQAIFEGRGYRTTLCETAAEALRVAPSLWFDIIVSDIGLPQTDGYELIRQLRRLPHLRHAPAVALTGYAAPKDAEAALLAGFDAHIPKPVDPAALSDAVERLIKQKSEVENQESKV